MNKKLWWKTVLLLSAGSLFQLVSGGCLEAVVQRTIVAAIFD